MRISDWSSDVCSSDLAPADVALLPPVIEVLREASYIEHDVDGARPTHHLAARPDGGPPTDRGIGIGRVHPVELRVPDALHVGGRRHLDEDGSIGEIGRESCRDRVSQYV